MPRASIRYMLTFGRSSSLQCSYLDPYISLKVTYGPKWPLYDAAGTVNILFTSQVFRLIIAASQLWMCHTIRSSYTAD